MDVVYQEISVDRQPSRIARMGKGPPVVLLPSPLVFSPFYLPLARRLGEHFDAILVELPGSGRGPRLSEPWSFERYGRWVALLLNELDLGPAAIVTHSNAGPIGIWATVLAPSRVSALVLGDATGGDVSQSLARVLLGRTIDCFLELSLTLRNWHYVLYPFVFHTRNFLNQVLLSRSNLLNVAARVQAPTLLAWGRRDWTMPVSCARRLLDSMPWAELHLCRRGSHDWIIDRPDEFADAVIRFLNRVPQVSSSNSILQPVVTM